MIESVHLDRELLSFVGLQATKELHALVVEQHKQIDHLQRVVSVRDDRVAALLESEVDSLASRLERLEKMMMMMITPTSVI